MDTKLERSKAVICASCGASNVADMQTYRELRGAIINSDCRAGAGHRGSITVFNLGTT